VGRAVAPAVLLYKSKFAWEESPSRTGQRVPAFGGVLTVVANGHPGRPAGKCHRKYTASALALARKRDGNGEMVR
jgi:hypothetical protein